jgi:hypothetical protein
METQRYVNKCYGYEQCKEYIVSSLAENDSGSFDLSDRWCEGCCEDMFQESNDNQTSSSPTTRVMSRVT